MTRWKGDVSKRPGDERKIGNLQRPVLQHFTNARLEHAYRLYVGSIQFGIDLGMSRLMVAYELVVTYKVLKEDHALSWMTALMVCNFAALVAVLMLPSWRPSVWQEGRNTILPPVLLSHTVALHIFLRVRIPRPLCSGTDVLVVQSMVFQRCLVSRHVPTQALGYGILALYTWQRGHSETVGVLLLHTLIGLLLPCIIAWQSEYKARYNFLLEVAGSRPGRLPAPTTLDRLGTAWLLPVFLLQALHGPMFICHSMLKTGYSWWAIYLLMLAWSGTIIVYDYYIFVLT
ncbi:hypothetical protein F751_2704 [Auxenochlorella protothecoides]|uniref:Uncharacterized protein n=1 Tax=Auxenochlorella protothecoides TaxID=3075 RepID=A0A087SLX3_AUXPR|nr:hypothetical protein F751_2704 [Auxenochlorella protothecoides]KFM26727.1 hypothetical protein F751_2704 [Auxenochlorella protothecoides]